ncbi:MAG: protein kinase [bacterium]
MERALFADLHPEPNIGSSPIDNQQWAPTLGPSPTEANVDNFSGLPLIEGGYQPEQTEQTPGLKGLRPGQIIGGQYVLEEKVAETEMSHTWFARNLKSNGVPGRVIIKMVDSKAPGKLSGFDEKKQLRLEATFSADLSINPDIDTENFTITPIAYGSDIRGQVDWYSMSIAQGQTLDRAIRGIRTDGTTPPGALPKRLALMVVREIAIAMQQYHDGSHSAPHLDLKPMNVLVEWITENGEIKPKVTIIDFGTAAMMANGQFYREVNGEREDIVMASPKYISPEQAKFRNADTDHRSDIYSLGCMLVELVTGKVPFAEFSKSPATLFNLHANAEVSLAEIENPGITSIAKRMLKKAPSDRYQNMADIARDIETVLANPDAAIAA